MSQANTTHERIAERGALLVGLLRREERGLRERILLWGGLRVATIAALVLLALVAVGGLTPALPRGLGWLLAALAWAAVGFAAWRYCVRPLGAVPNLAVFARLVEERRDFRDMLRAALEWSQRGTPKGESAELVAATIDRAYDEARALHLTQLFAFPHRRRDGLLTLAAGAAIAVLAAVSPQAPGRALHGLAFRWPTPDDVLYGRLEVLSGDPSVLAGQGAEVIVREHGPRAPEMLLRYNDTGDLWKSRPLEPQAGAAGTPATTPALAEAETRDYVFRFEDVHNDVVYRFESRRRRTAEHRIRVVQRPIVNHLQLKLVPPAYTGRAPAALEEGRGDGMALLGSRVEIEATASSALRSARLVPEDAVTSALTLRGPLPMQTQGRAFGAQFVLRGDLRYHFELVDSLGHPNVEPVSYQLSAVEDRAPWVEVREPGHDADLPKSLQVPLAHQRRGRLRHLAPVPLLSPRARRGGSGPGLAAPQPAAARRGQHRRRRPAAGQRAAARGGEELRLVAGRPGALPRRLRQLLRGGRGQRRLLGTQDVPLSHLSPAPADARGTLRRGAEGRREPQVAAGRRAGEGPPAAREVREARARAEEGPGGRLAEAEGDRGRAGEAEAAGRPGAEDGRGPAERSAEDAGSAGREPGDRPEDGRDPQAHGAGPGQDAARVHGTPAASHEADLAGRAAARHGEDGALAGGIPEAAGAHQGAARAAAARSAAGPDDRARRRAAAAAGEARRAHRQTGRQGRPEVGRRQAGERQAGRGTAAAGREDRRAAEGTRQARPGVSGGRTAAVAGAEPAAPAGEPLGRDAGGFEAAPAAPAERRPVAPAAGGEDAAVAVPAAHGSAGLDVDERPGGGGGQDAAGRAAIARRVDAPGGREPRRAAAARPRRPLRTGRRSSNRWSRPPARWRRIWTPWRRSRSPRRRR